MKNKVKVRIEKDPIQVTGSIQNFSVYEEDWDLGSPIGNGETKLKAIESFIESWMLKYDEEVELEIIEQ